MRYDDQQKMSEILLQSRLDRGVSREHMAMALGVSKNTVTNWERGTSTPNMAQFKYWFHELSVNPFPYLAEFMYPDSFSRDFTPSDQREALHKFIDSVPDCIANQLHFIFLGKHGSSIYAIVQFISAHLHTDMRSRAHTSRSVKDIYEMAKVRNELVCDGIADPDLDFLEQSIQMARDAAIKKENSYVCK